MAALAFVASLFLTAAAQQLTACPTQQFNIVLSDGSTYAVCNRTDLQGPSNTILHPVYYSSDCATACSKDNTCKQAVYDDNTSTCHLKGAPLSWIQSDVYTVLTFTGQLAQQAPITACPYGQSTVTSPYGKVFASCPNTDFNIPSKEILNNIPSDTACADLCATRTSCTQAVWDQVGQVCHIKGAGAATNWQFNSRYTTLQGSKSAASTQNKGQWSDVIKFPIIPVAAYIVPAIPTSQRLLVFSSYGARAFSGPTGMTQYADYNFVTGAVSQSTITNTQHDMFCPGISSLADGRIVITGGENAEVSSIYDPASNSFVRGADMQIARGYQASTTLSDGRVFTIGGSFTGGIFTKPGEAYDPKTNAWTLFPGADPTPMLTTDHEGQWRTDNHAWLFGWKSGSIFQAGPSKAMNWFTASGNGSVTPAGTRNTVMDQMCGLAVMYEPGKIFTAGGSQDYTDSPATTRADLITINNPGQRATVERLPDMAYPRGFGNAVVLPDGKIMVHGGQRRSLVFTDTDSILIPELFDPATRTWTQLASAVVPRNYHAVALLLADATVFVGGGGMCPAGQDDMLQWCDRAKDHFDGEIYSPPYLFARDGSLATRPVIQQLSQTTANAGTRIKVTMADAGYTTFVIVRMGTATHSTDTDQRRVPLTAVQTSSTAWTVTLPSDAGIVIPGPWYLFAMRSGVPSVARTVFVAPK